MSKASVPDRHELDDRITDLMAIHEEDIAAVLAACFPEFSLIMDGTPLFAKAECVVIRLVHKKTFEIVELIIHLGSIVC